MTNKLPPSRANSRASIFRTWSSDFYLSEYEKSIYKFPWLDSTPRDRLPLYHSRSIPEFPRSDPRGPDGQHLLPRQSEEGSEDQQTSEPEEEPTTTDPNLVSLISIIHLL